MNNEGKREYETKRGEIKTNKYNEIKHIKTQAVMSLTPDLGRSTWRSRYS
jgi:hypothetical protein